MVNGRVGCTNDFTVIKGNSKSVVDYILLPHQNLKYCTDFRVLPVNEFLKQNNLFHLLGTRSRAPDHSILMLDYNMEIPFNDCNSGSIQGIKSCKYNMRTIPSDFQNNTLWSVAVSEMIEHIENMSNTQEGIDTMYTELCELVHREMAKYLKQVSSRRHKKMFKYYKPYWDSDLSNSWNDMHECELKAKKCKSGQSEFVMKRQAFDRLLRKKEREYNRRKANDIDNMSTGNPKSFWQEIKQLGPNGK